MSEAVIREEFKKWAEGDNFTANCKLKSFKGDVATFVIGNEGDLEFTLKCPADYPATKARFSVASKDDVMEDWVAQVNEFCNGPSAKTPAFTLEEVLSECANSFAELIEPPADDADGYDMGGDHDIKREVEQKKATKKEGPSAKDFFVPPQGTGSATARLLSDLERVRDADWGRKFGFFAELTKDPETGMPDLYHWMIKLVDFDKDDSLYHELQKRKMDHILLEFWFPFDYPNNPPFVRVVRPRFAFRTGHVTVGGSICMEVLTSSGWLPTNDVETVIIQIRAEMNGGGARLDHDNHTDYDESEAFAAFDRVAGDHKWKVPDWRKYRRSYR